MTAREAVLGVWVIGGFILSLYSAMGVFAPERTDGTLTFLASKPLAPSRVFLCKWFFGWLNVSVPMAACGLLALLVESRSDLLKAMLVGLVGVWMATVFYSMTCCLAPRRAGEAQVGFVGLMAATAYLLHVLLFELVWGSPGNICHPLTTEIFASLNPLYMLELSGRYGSYKWPVVVPMQLTVFVVVMWVGYRKWQRSI
jgi:hypothetical protein